MAIGRRDAEWHRTAWLAAHFVNALGGKIDNFLKLLPFRTDESAIPETTGTVEDMNRMMGLS